MTSANLNSVLPALTISQEVKEEIRNSVAVGKVVTVSQKNVTIGGWTGIGYMVSDPLTGSGAYRISGGSNGGQLSSLGFAILVTILVLSVLPLILMAATLGTIAIEMVATVSISLAWISIKINMPTDTAWRTFATDVFGGIWGTIVVGIFTGLTVPAMLAAIFVSLIYAVFDAFVYAVLNFSIFARLRINSGRYAHV